MKIKKLYLIVLSFFMFFHATAFSQSIEDRIRSLQSELDELIKSESVGPKKTFITHKTRDIGHAMYLKIVERKIEQFGTENFPSIDGMRLYGNLIVNIPIFQDGSIFGLYAVLYGI